jgi:hypothetical protein
MFMNRFWVIGLLTVLMLSACSAGVETVTIPDPSSVPTFDSSKSTDGSLATEAVPSTDTILPSVTSDEMDTPVPTAERELEIVTLLPKDAIPAIDDPLFISADEADAQYGPDELVIGVQFDGDARAYSIPLLSSHEIVNDTVGGRKISVTW